MPARPWQTNSSRPRTGSRVAAVQALFQSEQSQDNPETVIDQFVRHRLGKADFDEGHIPDADVALFAQIVRQSALQQDTIDRVLAGILPKGWPLVRIDPVLRALLRAGMAELAIGDAPPNVIINEYLDVAHGFFSGEESKLVNAVLDRVAKTPKNAS